METFYDFLRGTEKFNEFGIAQVTDMIMSKVMFQRALIQVELPFSDIAFVLPITETDQPVTQDVYRFNLEDRHAVVEKQAIEQDVKLRRFDLLDIAIELCVPPITKGQGERICYRRHSIEHIFSRNRHLVFCAHRGKLYFNPFSLVMIKEVVKNVFGQPGSGKPFDQ